MNKRFIIMLNSATAEQNNALLEWIKFEQVGWWHWLKDSWLIATRQNHLTAESVRDKIGEICPGVHNLVIELKEGEGTWAGFGPNTDDKNMFTWLKDNWK